MCNGQEEPNNIPLYVKVYNQLLKMISEGQFGEKLPSELKLVDKLNVSRTTLRQALLVLQEDRIIYKKHGSGTYINMHVQSQWDKGIEKYVPFTDYLADQEIRVEVKDLAVTIEEADGITSEALQIDEGSVVIVVSRNYGTENAVLAHAIDFLPKSRLSEKTLLNFNSNNDLLKLVEGDTNVHHAETSIIATKSGEYLSGKLNIPRGYPLVLLNQILVSGASIRTSFNKTYINTAEVDLNLIRKL